MHRIDPKRAKVFIGVFGIIAITEASLLRMWNRSGDYPYTGSSEAASRQTPQGAPYLDPEIRRSEALAKQRSAEDSMAANLSRERSRIEAERAALRAAEAAAARAKFLARYLNSGFQRTQDKKMVAIAVVSENQTFNRSVSAALAQRFKNESVQIVPSLFTPEFISDGFFNTAFTDSRQVFTRLELATAVDAFLLARQKVRYSKNGASLENVLTANMELEVALLPAAVNGESQSWNFVANGAGFAKPAARALAEERLIKQITNDTKMSFSSILGHNPNQ